MAVQILRGQAQDHPACRTDAGDIVLGILWTILVIVLIVWLIGLIAGIAGNLIHLLLIVALAILIYNLLVGRWSV